MNIAVIGDYESPDYKILVDKVKLFFPDETVADLSRHTGESWKSKDDSRIADIADSHLIIVSNKWHDHIDARHDLWEAQKLRKEISLEVSMGFIPFNAYSNR